MFSVFYAATYVESGDRVVKSEDKSEHLDSERTYVTYAYMDRLQVDQLVLGVPGMHMQLCLEFMYG